MQFSIKWLKIFTKKIMLIVKSLTNRVRFKVFSKMKSEEYALYKKEKYVFIDRQLDFYRHRPFHQFLKEQICSRQTGIRHILEIGCNAGQQCFLIAKKYPKIKVVGIDLNKDAIKHAKKNYCLPNLEFYAFDALSQNFVQYFSKLELDLIFCFETIEHLFPAQMAKLFRNIADVASKNTLIIFTTPLGHASDDGYHHVQFFSFEKFERTLAKFFKIERVGKFRYNLKLNKYHDVLFAMVYKRNEDEKN